MGDQVKVLVWNKGSWRFIQNDPGKMSLTLKAYKNAWIIYNRATIELTAGKYNIPALLLALIAWVEVGERISDHNNTMLGQIDDWNQPYWTNNLAIRHKRNSNETAGFAGRRFQNVASVLHLNPQQLTLENSYKVIKALQTDIENLDTVGNILKRCIAVKDRGTIAVNSLANSQLLKIGARYLLGSDSADAVITNAIRNPGNFGSQLIRYKIHVQKLIS